MSDLLDRIADKFTVGDGCWLWTGSVNEHGYGRDSVEEPGETRYIHRRLFEMIKGPIPDGLGLDHKCHTEDPSCKGGKTCLHRRCVNPGHLEPVTQPENVARGKSGQYLAERTHCPKNHEYNEENTYITPKGKRDCKACRRVADAKRYNKNKGMA